MTSNRTVVNWLTSKDLSANSSILNERLDNDASRLFSDVDDEAEIWHLGCDGIKSVLASNSLDIMTALQSSQRTVNETFCIIRQKHTWSRLNVTHSTFKGILDAHNVLPRFMDLVRAFGVKFDEDAKIRAGCSTPLTCSGEGTELKLHYEMCYNVRYVDKYERPSRDPWCIRQVCIYQQVKPRELNSFWILIQPPKALLDALKPVLQTRYRHSSVSNLHPLTLHYVFLEVLLMNWEDYIEALRVELAEIDDKACFSNMGIRGQHDCKVTFKDTQKLQLLRQRLFRAQSILDSHAVILDRCKNLSGRLAKLKCVGPVQDTIDADFETCNSQVTIHRNNIKRMIEYSQGTSLILSKILEFRNDEVVLQTNQTVKDNLEISSHIAIQEGQVAEQGRKDSKLLKALNVIAIVYLPASLIATIFSSNLVDTQPNVLNAGKHFVVADQFWIYVVITAALTFFTFACSLLLSRKWTKP